MQLQKTISEEQTFDEEKIITFPNGIPGFQDCKEFRLSFEDNKFGSRFYWIQSIDESATTFSLIDPVAFGLNYQVTLSDADTELLKADNADDIAVMLMVSKKSTEEEGQQSSLHANINGPLVINTKSRLGLQKVLGRPDFSVNVHG